MSENKEALEHEVEELAKQLAAKQDELAKLDNAETADQHVVSASD